VLEQETGPDEAAGETSLEECTPVQEKEWKDKQESEGEQEQLRKNVARASTVIETCACIREGTKAKTLMHVECSFTDFSKNV
jgi:hypothetical protein